MPTVTMDIPEDIADLMVCDNKSDELRRNALLLYPFIKNETISHGVPRKFWVFPNGNSSNFTEARAFPISTRAGMKPSRTPPTSWNSFPRGKNDCRI